MGNSWWFGPGQSWFRDVVWQAGLFLLAGLAASFVLRRRPARAHCVLLLAILGSLLAPLGSQLAHRQGWGLWATASVVTPLSPASPPVAAAPPVASSPGILPADVLKGAGPIPPAPQRSGAVARLPIEGWVGARDWSSVPLPLRDWLLRAWLVLSGLCLVRLVVSMILGYQVVGRARPIACGSLAQAAESAATRLGLRVPPELRASARTACPAIWCWGRRPIILLPETAAGASAVDWTGVFCHELAHWARRDHWSGLLAEVFTCLLPWHPLAWWAKHRLGQLSELACDDWALSTGLEATDYAETLLGLVPQRRRALALAAVSGRGGLIGRVRHILDEPRFSPVVSTRWTTLSALAMVTAASVLALAQTRPTAAPRTSPGDPVRHRVIRGTVRDASGKPVAGASIFVVGRHEFREPVNGWYFTHRGQESDLMGQVAADRDGRFVLDLAIDPAVLDVEVIARSAGMGLAGRNFGARPEEDGQTRFEPLDDRPIELTLRPNFPIEGRLLSEAGTPVSGVSVALSSLVLGERPALDGFWLRAPEDGEGRRVRRPYWPEPVVTDSQGRFRLDGFTEKAVARIVLVHDRYIHEELAISTESEWTGWRKAWRIRPTAPRFTHVLEAARPIEGIVTDKDTGKPLAGVHVEIHAMDGGSLPRDSFATTDTQGRYRVTGVAWDYPQGVWAQLIPDASSGYLPAQHDRKEWPAGAAELRWNLTVEKGKLVRGRIIDAGTKQPIAGARVIGEHHSQTVLSDREGNFAIWVDPRYRSLLLVESPTAGYQRMAVPRGDSENDTAVYHPHGYARIPATPNGTIAPVEIALRKGATIAAQAVDSDGRPLRDVWASGESVFVWTEHSGAGSGRCALGSFRSSSFEPGQTYRIFFIQDERPLAGFADLTARSEPVEPVPVILRPTARVRGKLLRPDGSPDRQKGFTAYFPVTRDEIKLHPMDFLGQARLLDYGQAARRGNRWFTKTNDAGEFEVEDLVAGVRHYLVFYPPLSSAEVHYIPLEPLRPGEVRDLGAVKPIVLADRNP